MSCYQPIDLWQEWNESIQIATDVLNLKPDSYEALYVRAKAKRHLG